MQPGDGLERIPQEERVAIMERVKRGEITVGQAVAEAKQKADQNSVGIAACG